MAASLALSVPVPASAEVQPSFLNNASEDLNRLAAAQDETPPHYSALLYDFAPIDPKEAVWSQQTYHKVKSIVAERDRREAVVLGGLIIGGVVVPSILIWRDWMKMGHSGRFSNPAVKWHKLIAESKIRFLGGLLTAVSVTVVALPAVQAILNARNPITVRSAALISDNPFDKKGNLDPAFFDLGVKRTVDKMAAAEGSLDQARLKECREDALYFRGLVEPYRTQTLPTAVEILPAADQAALEKYLDEIAPAQDGVIGLSDRAAKEIAAYIDKCTFTFFVNRDILLDVQKQRANGRRRP